MNSINFPNMFQGGTIVNSENSLLENHKETNALSQSLHLLLSSERGELFGDPDFGVKIKKYTFHQNDYILRDILIDELYTQISTFCPAVFIERSGITINQSGKDLIVYITYKNRKDFTTNSYNLVLKGDNN